MEFIMILLLLSVWIFWSWVMWDLSSATRGWICTLCIGRWRLKHWTTREVPKFIFNWRIITLQCCIGFYCTAMWISWTSFSIYFNLILFQISTVYIIKSYTHTHTHTHTHISVQFSCSVMSDSLRPHESQHARPPCPSPTPGVHSNSCPSSWWCHPAISSSVVHFSSCPQSLPASGSFPMSQLFTWGGRSTGVSALASSLPKNTQTDLL